jgi:hypothetical protein
MGRIKTIGLAGACVIALLAAGCGLFEDEPDSLELGPPEDQPGQQSEDSQPGPDAQQAPAPGGPPAEDLPESLDTENLTLYSAEDAPQAPELTVKKPDGSTTTLQPAQEDKVVMIVCWSVSQTSGQAAAIHANQLGRRYYGQGLRILGLVSVRSGRKRGGRRHRPKGPVPLLPAGPVLRPGRRGTLRAARL